MKRIYRWMMLVVAVLAVAITNVHAWRVLGIMDALLISSVSVCYLLDCLKDALAAEWGMVV